MIKIVILVFDGCVAGATAAPADLFMTANMLRNTNKAGKAIPVFTVMFASPDGKPVQTGSGQVVTPQVSLDEIGKAELVIVPGIFIDSERAIVTTLIRLETLTTFLQRMHNQGSQIATVCTGAFILAESGLLDSRHATTTWWLTDLFCKRYPNVQIDTRQMVVESGQLVTAAAGTSYLDLSLFLIQKLAGANLARQCAAYLCLDGPRESQNAYAIPHHRHGRDPFIERADRLLRESIDQSIDVTALAQRLSVSTRTLVRRFKTSIGQTPSNYIQQVRMDHAKYLLENTRLGISAIADRSGYSDEDAFRRAFRKHSAETPTAFRRRVKNI